MLAYSVPTTPAPSTVMVFGMRGSCRIVSESKTVSPSKGTSSGRFGRDPVAITKNSPVRVRTSPPPGGVTATAFGPAKRPWPCTSSTA
jgi:hypothetical protein